MGTPTASRRTGTAADHPAGGTGRRATELRGRAMGSRLHLVVVTPVGHGRDPESIVDACVAEVTRLESLWSRFVPASEISMLNRGFGPQLVSAETRDLVARSVDAWHRTNGRFDPTVHDVLVGAGYDQDFATVARRPPGDPDRARVPSTAGGRATPSRCGAIIVDHRLGTVALPTDTSIDPGGIGKGLAADRVTELAVRLGAAGVMVNLGGDLRCRGAAPTADGWLIGARSGPDLPGVTLAIGDGGVATSTSLRRRWSHNGGTAHHLIDPALGQSRSVTARQVTVVAATAADAETTATALAAAEPVDLTTGADVDAALGGAGALVVDHRGVVHRLGPIDRFLR